MIKEMLWVLMDGIKDANMMLDYAGQSTMSELDSWFMSHAKRRFDELNNDYNFIKQQTGIEQKMRECDPIAEALDGHIMHEMSELKRRLF